MEPAVERLAALNEEADDERSRDDDQNDSSDLDPYERLQALLPPEFRLPRSHSEPIVTRAHSDREAGDAFSFSFSEDDLVPAQFGWERAKAANYYHHVPESQPDFTSQRLYSLSPDHDSRISVSRSQTVSVSAPQTSHGQHSLPLSPIERNKSPPFENQRPTRSLSRTFSNLRKGRFTRTDSTSPEKLSRNTSGISTPEVRRQDSGRDSGYGSSTVKKNAAEKVGPRNEDPEAMRKSTSMFRRRSAKLTVNVNDLNPAVPNIAQQSPPSPKRLQVTPARSVNEIEQPVPSRTSTMLRQIPGVIKSDIRKKPKPAEPKKKDELASVFRQLDDNFQKFQIKTGGLRVGLVKAALLPALKSSADHPSNKSLHPDDLDRRTTVLSKWWKGMLDMLDANSPHAISGSDRATLLEAITFIMDRQEWRNPPSSFAPLSDRIAREERRASHDTTSSDESDFLVESVQHNVRNSFISTLFSQVAIVVDRMSLRHAPASFVAFCGKTCAYAFFFCPGIADILVRLWNIQPAVIKRVVFCHGLSKGLDLREISSTVASAFPQPAQGLAFSSLRQMGQTLREKPILPLGVEKVQWAGHWVGRWCGRDSDLFYVFVRHYFSLVSDFLPANASAEERLCAPGYALVQAQLLANLDSTVNRVSTATAESSHDSVATFDDLLLSDGSVSALPPPPLNATRMMADNRIIMLMRDIFVERRGSYAKHCLYFAESIGIILKASARSISVYNHNACFTLCDFLQEAFVILLRFQQGVHPDRDFLDWPFWLEVFVTMTKSQNTMTEIRLYSFLFAIWATLTVDEAWRVDLCRSLLLEESHFDRTFQHWCPMVRAYYMRLICWRIARLDGDASDAEVEILKLLMARLQKTWRHFRFLLNQSSHKDGSLPSTAACNPAPGRRLLIIRTDSPSSTGLASASMQTQMNSIPTLTKEETSPQTPPQSSSGMSSLFDRITSPGSGAGATEQTPDNRGRRPGMFRSLLSYRFSNNDRERSRSKSPQPEAKSPSGAEQTSDGSSAEDSEDNSRSSSPEENNGSRTSMYEPRPQRPLIEMAGNPRKATVDRTLSASPPTTIAFKQASFKFSLEPVDRRPQNLPQDMRLQPPRIPLAAQLLLQGQNDYSPDLRPKKSGLDTHLWTYTGRALAEWTLVVNECQNFFERRRNEGVPGNKLVETPTLGVESFRRPG